MPRRRSDTNKKKKVEARAPKILIDSYQIIIQSNSHHNLRLA